MLVQTSAPSIEPVTLAEARLYCRVDATDEDAMLTDLIVAARQDAEAITQRSFITQGWRLVLDGFPEAIELERGNVLSVASVTYQDMTGVWQTMPTSDYVADLSRNPARITPVFGKVWPIPLPQIGTVKVDYTAGYGPTAADVPSGIKRWIKMRVNTIYEYRAEVAIMPRGKVELLPYIDGLLDPFRIVRY